MQGICTGCGESLFQCPSCRNVNYEKVNTLICTECGFSKYGKIAITLTVQLGFGTGRIEGNTDRKDIQGILSKTFGSVISLHKSLREYKCRLKSMLRPATIKIGRKPGRSIELHNTYMNSCIPSYKQLVKLLRDVNSIKSELVQYENKDSVIIPSSKLEPSCNCYGCSETFIQIFLKFIEVAADIPFCCDLFKELSLQKLIFSSILPHSSPIVSKLSLAALASLSANNNFFTEETLKQVETTLEPLKQSCLAKTQDTIVFNIKLLIQTHSKLLVLIVKEGNKRHQENMDAVNKCFWRILKQSFPIPDAFTAELIIQPMLNHITEILVLPFEAIKSTIDKQLIPIGTKELFSGMLKECLTYSECSKVRETAEMLLKRLFEVLPDSTLPSFNTFLTSLDSVFKMPQETSENLINVFKHLASKLQPKEFNKLDVIKRILNLVEGELDRLKADNKDVELWTGYGFAALLSITRNIINKEEVDNEITYKSIVCYVKAMKLITIANNYIANSITTLKQIIQEFPLNKSNNKKQLILQCIRITHENRDDKIMKILLYIELERILSAKKPEPNYHLTLESQASQSSSSEESLKQVVYTISDIGKIVKDLHSKILKETKVEEGKQAIEVLVADRVIRSKERLTLVYEKVWWPYLCRTRNPEMKEIPQIEDDSKLEPMKIVYRLVSAEESKGEEKVEELKEDDSEQDANEPANAFFSDIGKTTGFAILLDDIEKIDSSNEKGELAEKIMNLYESLLKIKGVRTKIIELGGADVLAKKAIELINESTSDKFMIPLKNLFKQLTDKFLTVKNSDHIKKLLEKIATNSENKKQGADTSNSFIQTVIEVLPYFAYGNAEAMNCLIEFFKVAIQEDSTEATKKADLKSHRARCIEIVEAIPPHITVLHDAFITFGITKDAINYIKQWMSNDDEKYLTGLQYSLKLLMTIYKKHKPTQDLIGEIIEDLYRVAANKTNKTFMILRKLFVEQILSSSDCPELTQKLKAVVETIQKEKKVQTEERKQGIFAKFTSEKTAERATNEIVCTVCNKGYSTSPKSILGVHVFSQICDVVNTGATALKGKKEKYFLKTKPELKEYGIEIRTLTQMSAIHLECNVANEKADASEEAEVKPAGDNSSAIYKNWFPISGKDLDKELYKVEVNNYFDRISKIIGEEQDKLVVMVNDIRCMLSRLAYEESFREYSNDEGILSNVQFIPFMMQLALHLKINGGTETSTNDALIDNFFLSFSKAKLTLKLPIKLATKDKKSLKAPTRMYLNACTLMLLTYTPSEWADTKPKLLDYLLVNVLFSAASKIAVKEAEEKATTKKVLDVSDTIKANGLTSIVKEIRPLLIFLFLIDSFKTRLEVLVKKEVKTKEEYMKELYEGIKNDHETVLQLSTEIYKFYSDMALKLETIEEFLVLLDAPKDTIEQYKELPKMIIKQ